MPDLSLRLLINAFAILGALFALWKGSAAERIAAVIVIANAVLGEGSHWLLPNNEDVIRLLNDGLTALALLVVTVRYAALWMGGVMLFFAAQFSLHAYYLVMERPSSDYLHALINNIDFSGITWCLVIGTIVAWRARLRRARAEGSWAA
jgi:superoxide dismutase